MPVAPPLLRPPHRPAPGGVTRRRFAIGAGALTTAGALTACGNESSAGAGSGTGTSAGDTLRFTYGGADVTVPRNPRRVVTIQGRVDLELALLAGYPVVGSGNAWMPSARVGSQFTGVTVPKVTTVGLGNGTQVDYEQILGLEPDLIVMPQYGYESDWYGNERLEQIAPVLGVSEEPVDWRAASSEQMRLLGRDQQIRTHIKTFDEKLARLRPRLAEKLGGRKVAFGVVTDDAFSVWTRTMVMSVAKEAGLDVLFYDPKDENNSFELSTEQFNRLDRADLVIRQAVDAGSAKVLDARPTWKQLPAARNRKVVTMDGRFSAGLVLTATGFLDVLAEAAELYA
ncbi:ABC transporter substrate-binding protein [Streptomyces albipurpureus]|uniref:ABC transporter substrate-binding protein n=1 Tax=Streptomyces albipurpureus TaxID=2897419 RepID=A0ABT0ULL0_9ACTN|nr:ABC transporter substrate-binding protein [Streptomyces sp. CWNU-1]MCM2389502.1 ABC transporter substrate-binding protein [Streptomyces sp. CWNU-1]